MRRELPAEFKREAERQQRKMHRAVLSLQSAARELGRCDGMTGNAEADKDLAVAEAAIQRALNILT